jgi:hypothetical protein
MTDAGLTPDPWQETLLRSHAKRFLLLCGRQTGKSTAAAALALWTALMEAPALVLLLSPTERQSAELFRDKVKSLYAALGRPVAPARETALTLTLRNGSRIVALPGKEETIRCYSGVSLLVVDEASRVLDPLYYTIRPMLSVSGGRLLALSTPFGKRGWFYDEWHGQAAWERIQVTADQCPRIPKEFLAEEKASIGERWYRQEYGCSFEEAVDSVFRYEDIIFAFAYDVLPVPFDG